MSNDTDNLAVYAQSLAEHDPLGYDADDAGTAAFCVPRLHDKFLYIPRTSWMVYTGTHWTQSQA